MSDIPVIKTAIPRRRYRLGEYEVTLLGEVESGDGIDYRYILAFVEEGRGRPTLFVCSERNPPGERAAGSHRLRMANEVMSEVLDSGDSWSNIDAFADEGLSIGRRVLGLKDEQAHRLA